MARKLIYVLLSIGSVFLAAILLVFLLTDAGSRWLVNHATSYVPGQLTIGRIQGSVLSDLNLYEINQYVDQRHLQIQHVKLDWQPTALLGGKILFRNVQVSGITYTAPEINQTYTKKAIQRPHDFSIPFPIILNKAKLSLLTINQGGNQYLLDVVHLDGQINQDDFRLKRLEAQGMGMHVYLQGHIGLCPPYPIQTNLSWDKRSPSQVQAQGRCDISGDINSLKFKHELSAPLDIDARGEIKINRNLMTKDKTALYDLSLRADFTGPGLPPTYIETHAQSDFTVFRVDHLIAHTLGGMIKVNGHIVLEPEPKGELTVHGEDIDPGLRWPDWSGKLAFDANVKGGMDVETPTISLHELVIVGQFIDQPIKASGNLSFQGISQVSGDLKVHSGSNALNMGGTVAEHLEVKFDFDTPNPVNLWPGLRGHFQGKGIIKGTRSLPSGSIILHGNNITYGDYSVQTLYADLVLDSNKKLPCSKVELSNIQVDDEVFKRVTLNSVGKFKKHKVSMDIVTPSVQANIEFEGSSYKDVWEAKVNNASFDPIQYGRWRLCSPVNLILTHEELKPFNVCWSQKKSSLHMQGSWNEESGWKLKGDVNNDPLKGMIDTLKEVFNKEHLRWEKNTPY